jgi:hypothetical protein
LEVTEVFHLSCFAYLDPSSGSTIFQIVVATVISGIAALRLSWKRVRSLFSRSRSKPDDPSGC